MAPERKAKPVTCPTCGQRGDQRPGLRLDELPGPLSAVFIGDQPVPLPQRLTCRACGASWAVARDSIEVRRDG